MDPVTHITAGVLLGQAAKDRFPGVRALVPLSALAGHSPQEFVHKKLKSLIAGDKPKAPQPLK